MHQDPHKRKQHAAFHSGRQRRDYLGKEYRQVVAERTYSRCTRRRRQVLFASNCRSSRRCGYAPRRWKPLSARKLSLLIDTGRSGSPASEREDLHPRFVCMESGTAIMAFKPSPAKDIAGNIQTHPDEKSNCRTGLKNTKLSKNRLPATDIQKEIQNR